VAVESAWRDKNRQTLPSLGLVVGSEKLYGPSFVNRTRDRSAAEVGDARLYVLSGGRPGILPAGAPDTTLWFWTVFSEGASRNFRLARGKVFGRDFDDGQAWFPDLLSRGPRSMTGRICGQKEKISGRIL